MPERYEIRCSGCGLVEIAEQGDQPEGMALEIFAEWLGTHHRADCFGTDVSVEETVDVAAQTAKYDTGGVLDGD